MQICAAIDASIAECRPARRSALPLARRVRRPPEAAALRESQRGARVLDLCCGSGMQGVVALCRGAASVTFVDTSRRALAFCRVNVLGCERRGRLGDARFLRCDARHARDVALRAGGRAFDVVLANPPFVAGGSARFASGGS